MRKYVRILVYLSTFSLLACAAFQAITWEIGDGYAIRFHTKGVEGVFSSLQGTIQFDPENLQSSKFDVTVDAASINTGNGLKNKHAKSESWFDTENYPEIRFTTSRISKSLIGFEATGDLQMHGIEKEIAIPFTFKKDTFTGHFEVDRLAFKIGSATGLQGKVGTKLKIDLVVPVVLQ